MGSGAAGGGGTVGGNPIAPVDIDALRHSCPMPPAPPDVAARTFRSSGRAASAAAAPSGCSANPPLISRLGPGAIRSANRAARAGSRPPLPPRSASGARAARTGRPKPPSRRQGSARPPLGSLPELRFDGRPFSLNCRQPRRIAAGKARSAATRDKGQVASGAVRHGTGDGCQE